MNLEVLGVGSSHTVLLPLNAIPFVEIYVRRPTNGPFLDGRFEFSHTVSEGAFVSKLQRCLFSTRGDTSATVQVMMQYYKCLGKRVEVEKSNEPTIAAASKGTFNAAETISLSEKDIHTRIKMELNTPDLETFANDVDSEYEDAMASKLRDFSSTSDYLVPPSTIRKYFNRMKLSFPTLHYFFAVLISNTKFIIDMDTHAADEVSDKDASDLHRKERIIFHIFLAVLRTKSRDLLPHYAMVEPLGLFF